MRKSLLFIFFLFLSQILPAQWIHSVDINVYIDDKGDAYVKQQWDVSVVSGTEWYIPIGNLNGSSVRGLTVSEDGLRYEFTLRDGVVFSNGSALTASDVKYSFEQYSEHLELTRKFAESHPNLTLEFDSAPTFRNITYTIIANKLVIVSKNKSPAIHFVIHHKKMVQAFMNFIPPIKE